MADGAARPRGSKLYPVTDDGWVTFQRVTVSVGGDRRVVLVQKRDGSTRTVLV